MRALVFGATGLVGRALVRAEWPHGVEPTFLDRRAADLSDPQRPAAIVAEYAPDIVIVAAAYTAVDAAESDEAQAYAVNAAGPGAIARATAAAAIPIVHLSTDCVFDGEKDSPYEEDDPVGPVNAYGRSKLAGEQAVRAANPRHLILRTSWVYGPHPHASSFLQAMLRAAREKLEIRVVADQYGSPTAADDLAAAIVSVLPRLGTADAPFGTYHLAGAQHASRYAFAEAIFAGLKARGLRTPRCIPIAHADYPSAAPRPVNGRLSSERFAATFGFRLPGYGRSLPATLDAALAALETSP